MRKAPLVIIISLACLFNFAVAQTVNTSNKVKISPYDTTAAYLLDKIIAGSGISIIQNNARGNDSITISGSGGGGGSGTVTSVSLTTPTGLTSSSSSCTTACILGIALTSGYSIPLITDITNWNLLVSNPIWKYLSGIVYTATSTDQVIVGASTGTGHFQVTEASTTNTRPTVNINNLGSGIALTGNSGSSARLFYLGNQGTNTGFGTSDYQFTGSHADSLGVLYSAQRSPTGSGIVNYVQQLGTGIGLYVENDTVLGANPGKAVSVLQKGTSDGLFIDQRGNGKAVNISASSTLTSFVLNVIGSVFPTFALDIQKSGTTKFSVSPDGNLNVVGTSTLATTTVNGNFLQYKTNLTIGSSSADYITNGTADDVEFLQAMQYASTTGGKKIIVKSGDYYMRNPINTAGMSNVHLECETGARFIVEEAYMINFGYSYFFYGGQTDKNISIENCEFDGKYDTYAWVESRGGGVAPGWNWTVKRNTFRNFNYFPTWVGAYASSTRILGNFYYGPGRGSDHIGGGGGYGVEIAYNYFDSSTDGNSFDNTGGNGYSIHDNWSFANHRSFYVEAMTNVDLYSNHFYGGGGIGIVSDNGYHPVATTTNSSNISVHNNEFRGGGAISYTFQASSTGKETLGGDISIVGNKIYNPEYWGILVQGCRATSTDLVGTGYDISNNYILNPFRLTSGTSTFNTGCGVVHNPGIAVIGIPGVKVNDNWIIDDATSTQSKLQYGIEVGQIFSPDALNEPNYVTGNGNHVIGATLGEINIASPTYTTAYSFIQQKHLGGVSFIVGKGTSTFGVDFNTDIGAVTTDLYNLGSTTLRWLGLYTKNIFASSSIITNASTTNLSLYGRMYDSVNATGTSGQVLSSTGTSTLWKTITSGGDSAWTVGINKIYNSTSTDNVGIGTTNPNTLLSLGTSLAHNKFTVYDNGTSSQYGIGAQAFTQEYFIPASGLTRHSFGTYDGTTYTELMTINNSGGRVGIGTSSPIGKLDVYGNLNIATGTTPAMFVDTSKLFVGIGTSTPLYSFVNTGATSSLRDIIPETTLMYSIGASSSRYKSIWTELINLGSSTVSIKGIGDDMNFYKTPEASGIPVMVIKSNGNVGIGTTSPSSLFTVQGDINVTGSVRVNGTTISAGSGLTSLNGQTGSTQTFATGTTGTDFSITSSGNVHTFAMPSASASARGLLTASDFTLFTNKPSFTYASSTFPSFSYASSTYYLASNPSGYITSSALSPYALIASPTFTGTATFSNSSTTNATTTNITATNASTSQSFINRLGVNVNNFGSAAIEVKSLLTGALQGLRIEADNLANTQFSSFLTGDSFTRFALLTDGVMKWSSGFATPDTQLYRSATSTLKTDGTFHLVGGFRDGSNATGTSGQCLTSTGIATAWASCGGGGGGVSGGSAGVLALWQTGTSLTTSKFIDNGIVTGIGATSSTQYFNIASTTGSTMFSVGINGQLNLATSTATTTPEFGVNNLLKIFAKTFANKDVLLTKSASSSANPVQSALWSNRVIRWDSSGIAAGQQLGAVFNASSTGVVVTPTFTTVLSSTPRNRWSTVVTTLNQQVGLRSNVQFTTTATSGVQGYYGVFEFGFGTWTAGNALFVGFSPCVSGNCYGTTAGYNAQVNIFGIGIERNTTQMVVVTNDASGTISTSTISGLPTLATGNGYRVILNRRSGETVGHYQIWNTNTKQLVGEGSVNTNLPANNTLLSAQAICGNGANTAANACQLDLSRIYIETE